VSDDRPSEQPDARQRGVFGNLPDSRPGTRSPRRRTATGERAASGAGPAGATSKPRPEPVRRAAPAREPSADSAREPSEPPARERGQTAEEAHGVEDLAWAGVAAVAEAATLGVRLISRAMEAVHKPADRR
jgi:hypothetical protein